MSDEISPLVFDKKKEDKNVKGWQTDRPTDRWYTTGHQKRSAGEWIM